MPFELIGPLQQKKKKDQFLVHLGGGGIVITPSITLSLSNFNVKTQLKIRLKQKLSTNRRRTGTPVPIGGLMTPLIFLIVCSTSLHFSLVWSSQKIFAKLQWNIVGE